MLKVLKNAKEHKIANVKIITIPNHAKGLVTLYGSIPVGTCSNSKNIAVPVMLANLLSEGTVDKSKDAFQEELDYLGAELSFSSGALNTNFQLSCIPENLETVLSLLHEAMTTPRLVKKDFELVRTRVINKTMQLRDSTTAMAESAFTRLIYPVGHPMYVPSIQKQISMIKKITIADIKKFHKEQYTFSNAKIVIAGDIKHSVVGLLEKELFLSDTEEKANTCELTKYVKKSTDDTVHIESIKDKSTTAVFIGSNLSISKGHPDYWPLLIAIDILGRSGFTARLGKIVREEHGLTYHTYARLQGFYKTLSGYWFAYGTFAPKLTKKGLNLMKKVIKELVVNGPTKDELKQSKSGLLGLRITRITSTEQIAQTVHTLIVNDEPMSELEEIAERINNVTYKQVKDALKKHLDLGKISLSAAGSIDKDLKALKQ